MISQKRGTPLPKICPYSGNHNDDGIVDIVFCYKFTPYHKYVY